jgi:hypothetical protein
VGFGERRKVKTGINVQNFLEKHEAHSTREIVGMIYSWLICGLLWQVRRLVTCINAPYSMQPDSIALAYVFQVVERSQGLKKRTIIQFDNTINAKEGMRLTMAV